MVWAVVAAAAVSVGAGLYESSVSSGIANTQLGIEQDQQGKQDTAWQQLQTLINSPNSFFQNNTVYSAAFNQGTQAIATQSAASGLNNTSRAVPQGGEAQALQAYGQSFGAQQLLNQEQLLAGMSGTGYNPVSAGSAAQNSANSATGGLNSLAGLLSFFGSSGLTNGGSSTAVTQSTAMGSDDWLAQQELNTGGLSGFSLGE
jgi:hypothetical protein